MNDQPLVEAAAPRPFVQSRAAADSARRDVALAASCFVLSGAAALVYQVAWQRVLALTTGVAVYSVAIITAAFMAGIGIGSHAGGVLSARLTRRRSLLAFAAIELGIAAFAALSVPFYYGLLYRHASVLYDGTVRATVTHFLSLLPPTAVMGMSLPFLVRGFVQERTGAARTIGFLYGANALGAAAGALLTPWVLLRFLGVNGAVWVGAAGSATAALGVLVLALRTPRDEDSPTAPASSAALPPLSEAGQPFGLWVALYALSGFVCLSLEMVWFRILHVAAKGSAFTFGTLLSVYLLGLAAGTFAAARRKTPVQRPLAVFLMCQVGIVLATIVAHALMVWLPHGWPGVSWLVRYGTSHYGVQLHPFTAGETFSVRQLLAVYLGMPLVLFGPSTFLMGFGFPVLQQATQADPVTSGRRVGLLQAANIAGCVLGSLLTGLVLFEAVGTAGVFRILAGVSILVALFGLKAVRSRPLAGLAVALLIGATLFPGRDRLWRRLHGDPPAATTFIEEDAAGVTALTPEPEAYKLWISGRYNSWLPYGGMHTVVGALPAIAHPAPLEVAAVGLGSGDTSWAAGCREETQHVRVFEIASSQPQLLARIADRPEMIRLHKFLVDPRITIVRDDGRRRLRADGRQYDIIVADAIDYDTSMSNNLYSIEYYQLVRETLRPGGLVCLVAKTPRIRAALKRALPYTVIFGREDLLLASAEPIQIDTTAWLSRLHSPFVVDYLGKARVREIAAMIEKASYGRSSPPTADANSDLDPKDEFLRPSASLPW